MSKVSDLKNALTELFRKGTEVGYTETEIDEFLEDIDYHTLLQAVWDSAETVYAFRADGRHELSLNYRGAELFQQRATLLYEDMGEGFAGVVTAVRSMELWLLEDMGFAIVANFSLEAGNCEYIDAFWYANSPPPHLPNIQSHALDKDNLCIAHTLYRSGLAGSSSPDSAQRAAFGILFFDNRILPLQMPPNKKIAGAMLRRLGNTTILGRL